MGILHFLGLVRTDDKKKKKERGSYAPRQEESVGYDSAVNISLWDSGSSSDSSSSDCSSSDTGGGHCGGSGD